MPSNIMRPWLSRLAALRALPIRIALILTAMTVAAPAFAAEIPPIVAQTQKGLPRMTAGKAVVERMGAAFVDGQGPFAAGRGGDWRLSNDHIALTFAAVDSWPTTASMPIGGFIEKPDAAQRIPGALIDLSMNGHDFDFLAFFTQAVGLAAGGPKVAYDTAEPVKRGNQVGLQLSGSPFDNSLMRLQTTYWLAADADRVQVESYLTGLNPGDPVPAICDASQWAIGLTVDCGNGIFIKGKDRDLGGRYEGIFGGDFSVAMAPDTSSTLTGKYCAGDDSIRLDLVAKQAGAAKGADASTSVALSSQSLAKSADAPTSIALLHRSLWFGEGNWSTVNAAIAASDGAKMGGIAGTFGSKENLPPLKRPMPVSLFKVVWDGEIKYMTPKGSTARIPLPPNPKGIPQLTVVVDSDLKGNYSAKIPAGWYVISPGLNLSPAQGMSAIMEIQAGKTLKLPEFPREAPVGIRVRVVDDATSKPLAARVSFDPVPPSPAIYFDPSTSAGDLAYFNNIYIQPQGRFIEMPAGQYVLRIFHGPRDKMEDILIEASAAKTNEYTIRLKTVSPTPGWIGVEMGARTDATPGCSITADQYVEMAAAEDLDWVISGDFEHVTDLAPAIEKAGYKGRMRSSLGFRTLLPAHPDWGSLFVFPVGKNDPDPAKARASWADVKTSKEWIAALRKSYPNSLIQVDLPMTRFGGGYLSRGRLDANVVSFDAPADADMSFDALSVMPARGSFRIDEILSMIYNNRIQGRVYIPSTVPIERTVIGGEPGYPRVLVRIGDAKLDSIPEADMFKLMRAGRTEITNGPFIDFSIGDALPGGIVKFDPNVAAKVRVTGNDWCLTDHISVDKEGYEAASNTMNLGASDYVRLPAPPINPSPLDPPAPDKESYTLASLYVQTIKDTLLGVKATGKIMMDTGLPRFSPVSNNLPICIVTPIAVDANGNGKYDPIMTYILRGQ